MQSISSVIESISTAVWGWPMIILLLGTHIFMTFRLRFPQLRVGKAIRLSITKDKHSHGDVSQFGALATALAATIGTGNIVGVATAVALGGPGAVLWCWITGVFGMATKYSEGLLAVKYRVKTKDGRILGGPMFALERGLHAKWLAILFAVVTAIAAFGIGNTVQANSISLLLSETYGISQYLIGVILAVLVLLVIVFGVKGIAKVCSTLVPFMAAFYVLGCLVILGMNWPYLGESIRLICRSAFTTRAAGGGFVGSTVLIACRFGIARGLFSNESGLGSAPIVAAAAQTRNPVRQALVSSTGTFWDTVVVCAITGLVLVSSIVAHPDIDCTQGAALTKAAFDKLPLIGPIILSVGMILYMKPELGCGPRDTLMVQLGKRFPRANIGIVRFAMDITVFFIGVLLGAPYGWGSVFAIGCNSFIMQGIFRIFGFESRSLTHESLADTVKGIQGGHV